MQTSTGRRPTPDEYGEFSAGYISMVGDGDIVEILGEQVKGTLDSLRSIPEARSEYRYAEGKWSINEVVGHLIDTERVMAFRALSFGRGDTGEIAGMDQDQYVAEAEYNSCSLSELIDEFEALRRANIGFFRSLPDRGWSRGGNASGTFVTVRALAYIIAGHELHHLKILKERYLGAADSQDQ